MKNIDKIRQMNSEELAEIMSIIPCECCPVFNECISSCKYTLKRWLEQEVEE